MALRAALRVAGKTGMGSCISPLPTQADMSMDRSLLAIVGLRRCPRIAVDTDCKLPAALVADNRT